MPVIKRYFIFILLQICFIARAEDLCAPEIRNETVYAYRGGLATSNYPAPYLNCTDYSWRIVTFPQFKVKLVFEHFDLEESDECDYDNLNVTDYSGGEAIAVGHFCGSSLPEPIVSSENMLTLRFMSNQKIERTGFKATITSVLCGGNIREDSGVISSPFYPDGYCGDKTCLWYITVQEGYNVMLKIDIFLKTGLTNCSSEYLEVRDGHKQDDDVLLRLCNDSPTKEVQTTTNKVLVKYVNNVSIQNMGVRIYFNKSTCGGILRQGEGVVRGARFSAEDVECTWVIIVPEGQHVVSSFQKFQLPLSSNCSESYLDIYDGFNDTRRLRKRLCGSGIPEIIYSTENAVTLRYSMKSSSDSDRFSLMFNSDVDECQRLDHGCQHTCVNTVGSYRCQCYHGYELHFDGKKCAATCGGTITSGSGYIQSPFFPNLYPYGSTCLWNLTPDDGFNIFLNFTYFDLEKHNDCIYDFVEVKDLPSTNGVATSKRFCGSTLPVHEINPFTKHQEVKFVSDYSGRKSGFSALYTTDIDECANGNGGCARTCHNTIGSYYCTCSSGYVELHNRTCRPVTCGSHIQTNQGSIRNRDNPNYRPNEFCVWTITVAENNYVEVDFSKIELENSTDCSFDYVELRDGHSLSSPLLARLCGKYLSKQVVSFSSKLLVHFRTDHSVENTGFRATFKAKCGGHIKKSEGTLQSPNFPANYNPNTLCEWMITVPENFQVLLTFKTLVTESHENCNLDYIELRDGHNLNDPLLARLCGSRITENVVSSSNKMLVIFKTDHSVEEMGFSADYKAISCRGTLTGSGKVHSPNFPLLYPGNTTCTWTLQVQDDHPLVMSLTFIKLLLPNDCVDIYDVVRSSDYLIRRVCGNNSVISYPNIFYSTSNKVKVSFKTAARSSVNINSKELLGFSIDFFQGDYQTYEYDQGATSIFAYIPGILTFLPRPGRLVYSRDRTVEIFAHPLRKLRLVLHNHALENTNSSLEISEETPTGLNTVQIYNANTALRSVFTSKSNRVVIRYVSENDICDASFYFIYSEVYEE